MSDLRQAAQQALEALELLQNAIYNIGGEHVTGWGYANDAADSAEKPITALRAALAQQAEPVCRSDGRCQYAIDSGAEGLGHCPKGKCVMPEAAQQAEPVAWFDPDDFTCTVSKPTEKEHAPLYTHPPRREWVPLTDQEIDQIAGNAVDAWECARAIEAALKEKNHG